MLTQTPLQFVRLAVGQHLAIALPPQSPRQTAQIDPTTHCLLHCPQLASSVLRLLHVPPQSFRPDGQRQLVPEH